MENAWKPISTAPRDGTFFIATDGKVVVAGNWPKGCFFGTWDKKGENGSFSRVKPIYWMELPEFPHD